MVAAPAIPGPLPSEDRSLLDLVLLRAFNLPLIAEQAGRSLLDILDWLAAPHIRAAVAHYRALEAELFEAHAEHFRLRALQTLDACLDQALSPIEKRRAATNLLNALKPPRQPRSANRGQPQPHIPPAATPADPPDTRMPDPRPPGAVRTPSVRPTPPAHTCTDEHQAAHTAPPQTRGPLTPAPHATPGRAASLHPPAPIPPLDPLRRASAHPRKAATIAAAAGAPPRPP